MTKYVVKSPQGYFCDAGMVHVAVSRNIKNAQTFDTRIEAKQIGEHYLMGIIEVEEVKSSKQ